MTGNAFYIGKEKRAVPYKEGFQYPIFYFGGNNLYPQEMEEKVKKSGAASVCNDRYRQFLVGVGFEDDALNQVVAFSKGWKDFTLFNVLQGVVRDYAHWRNCAIHVNYNASYRITELRAVPFRYVRIGRPNRDARKLPKGIVPEHLFVGYSPNWQRTEPGGEQEPHFIHVFNPDPAVIREEVAAAGGWDQYKGQIYYPPAWEGKYEPAVIGPFVNDVDGDIYTRAYKADLANNGFSIAGYVEFPYAMPTTEDGSLPPEIQELRRFKIKDGDKSGGLLAFFNPAAQMGQSAQIRMGSFGMDKADEAFKWSEESGKRNIIEGYGLHPVLLGFDASGFSDSGRLLEAAYNFFNEVTQPDRDWISDIFKEIMPYFQNPINSDFVINRLEYITPEDTMDNEII